MEERNLSLVNENFLTVQPNYLFSTIAKKVETFTKENPEKEIIKLGIGDVTKPIVPACIKAMHQAVEEMQEEATFKGYGPEQGYEFLRKKIKEEDYQKKGIPIQLSEIFLSDGAKCDTANIQELFAISNTIAITNPVYPVYLDSNQMAGRNQIIYLPVTEQNQFEPELPKQKVDLIYLCFPNNPTGTVLTKQQLEKWVQYAKQNQAILLFDAAYEAFIQEENVPHSIYEIPGAKEVAIEFKSFSKTAGFTGIRCAYTIVPEELKAYTKAQKQIKLNPLWNRRQCTKFNGVSYITQKAAEATYSQEGKQQIKKNIDYYLENAQIILKGLKEIGIKAYGGKNSPYIWLKTPKQYTSWEFFDILLEKSHIVGTPGVGFGKNGEGYFRLTAFNTKQKTIEAMERMKKLI